MCRPRCWGGDQGPEPPAWAELGPPPFCFTTEEIKQLRAVAVGLLVPVVPACSAKAAVQGPGVSRSCPACDQCWAPEPTIPVTRAPPGQPSCSRGPGGLLTFGLFEVDFVVTCLGSHPKPSVLRHTVHLTSVEMGPQPGRRGPCPARCSGKGLSLASGEPGLNSGRWLLQAGLWD